MNGERGEKGLKSGKYTKCGWEAIYNRFCGNMVSYIYDKVRRLIAPQHFSNTNYSTIRIPTFKYEL
jgi:hypothetical protein